MKFRTVLAAATCLALPLAAAQTAHAQPVTGPYVSLGAGTTALYPFNASSRAIGGGKVQTRLSDSIEGSVGYGLGNGFRVELEGNYYRNTAHRIDGSFLPGIPSEQLSGGLTTFGGFVNGFYDLPVGLPIYPYVGAGVGYEWQRLNPHMVGGIAGTPYYAGAGGTKGSFAYQLIAGVSYPVDFLVPGLALTAEYRFSQLVQSRNYTVATNDPGVFGRVKVGQESANTFLVGLRYQLFQPPAPPPAPAPTPVAAPAPPPNRTYLVFFDWDKYNLTPRATQIIAQAAADSQHQNTTTIDVSGYTDTSGTPAYNQTLSLKRAVAVEDQLVADGVSKSEIAVHAFGETHLLVPTGPGVREPQNRRVEIVLH